MWESQESVKELKDVLVFNSKLLDEPVGAKYCVCGRGELPKDAENSKMVQSDGCWEWFHYGCAGYSDALAASGAQVGVRMVS